MSSRPFLEKAFASNHYTSESFAIMLQITININLNTTQKKWQYKWSQHYWLSKCRQINYQLVKFSKTCHVMLLLSKDESAVELLMSNDPMKIGLEVHLSWL